MRKQDLKQSPSSPAASPASPSEDSNAAQDILEESIIRRHNLVRLEDVEEPQDEGDLEGDEVWSD